VQRDWGGVFFHLRETVVSEGGGKRPERVWGVHGGAVVLKCACAGGRGVCATAGFYDEPTGV